MRNRVGLLTVFVCLLLNAKAHAANEPFDKFGGWKGLKGTKTGVFHVEGIHDRWWIVTPAGNVFWSTGVYSVRSSGLEDTTTKRRTYQEAVMAKHGNAKEWARVTRLRLRDWGFNTIGDWSSDLIYREPGFAYVAGVDLPRKAPNVIAKGAYGYFPDVFDPLFQQSVYASIEEKFKRQAYLVDDPWLLGYFLADEPSWYGSKQRHGALTDDFIALAADRPGKQAWVQFLKTKYLDISALNAAWQTSFAGFQDLLHIKKIEDTDPTIADKKAFLKAVALQFSRVLFKTLRQFDPHHMVLGTRPTRLYPEVLEAIGEYTDIFGISYYHLNTGYKIDPEFEQKIADIYQYGKKPIMLGVLIAGKDAGLPYGIVRSQLDRGISYWRYLAKVAADPRIVGMHWFQYFDPPRHCYDKMAANWGLVNQEDDPYQDAVSLIAQANDMVYAYALGLTSFAPDFDGVFGRVRSAQPQGAGEAQDKTLRDLNIPVMNGDFELRTRGWKLQPWKGEPKITVDNQVAHSGKHSLKITGAAEGWESIGVAVRYNPGLLLKPGLKYKLSVWIKTERVENFAQIRIRSKTDTGAEINYEAGGQYGTKDWTRYEKTFTPSEDNRAVYLIAQLVGTGTAWFDDIRLDVLAPEDAQADDFVVPTQPEPSGAEAVPVTADLKTRPLSLSNPGFEKGTKDWALQSWKGKPKTGIAWFKGRTGLRSLEIKGTADGWESVGVGVRNLSALAVSPDKKYLLTGWIKTAKAERALLKLKIVYDDGQNEYVESELVSEDSDWTEVKTLFQLKNSGKIEYLACQLIGRGKAWFDDITLAEIVE